MASAISAVNLVKKYGEKKVVDNISFEVNEGECFGILGPNGAGKTSTFKMIYGSSRLTSGELFLLGLSSKIHINKIKSMIGVVPQENGLDPDFSVLDNLLIYSSYLGLNPERAELRARELLRLIQLEDYGSRPVDVLSGGMKRRLTVARALLNDPSVLLLDEPTTGLDPQARNFIWEELATLKKKGKTMVITTHYMEEAEALCDRILIMHKGKAVVEGKPQDLIVDYIGREVVEFDIDPKEIEYYMNRIKDRYDYQVMRNRLKVFIRGQTEPRDIIGEIPSRNITVRKASLNDVFLRIAGHELSE
jgi:lipooligosaccharide transport system ATP-binding protein